MAQLRETCVARGLDPKGSKPKRIKRLLAGGAQAGAGAEEAKEEAGRDAGAGRGGGDSADDAEGAPSALDEKELKRQRGAQDRKSNV